MHTSALLSYLAAPDIQKKTRSNSSVPRLLIKPILAAQNICHPSVCRTAAETVMPLQECGFPQQKCSTALKLRKASVDNSSCREFWLTTVTKNREKMSQEAKHKTKYGLERTQTDKRLGWKAECLIRLSRNGLCFKINLHAEPEWENTPAISANGAKRRTQWLKWTHQRNMLPKSWSYFIYALITK